jgi:hypothetical protein
MVSQCEQVRRLHGFDVSKELLRRVVEDAAAAASNDEDEAARAAAAAEKQKKREEDAAAAAKLKLENLVNEGECCAPFSHRSSVANSGKAGVAGQWTSVRIVNLKEEEEHLAAANVKFNAGLCAPQFRAGLALNLCPAPAPPPPPPPPPVTRCVQS